MVCRSSFIIYWPWIMMVSSTTCWTSRMQHLTFCSKMRGMDTSPKRWSTGKPWKIFPEFMRSSLCLTEIRWHHRNWEKQWPCNLGPSFLSGAMPSMTPPKHPFAHGASFRVRTLTGLDLWTAWLRWVPRSPLGLEMKAYSVSWRQLSFSTRTGSAAPFFRWFFFPRSTGFLGSRGLLIS